MASWRRHPVHAQGNICNASDQSANVSRITGRRGSHPFSQPRSRCSTWLHASGQASTGTSHAVASARISGRCRGSVVAGAATKLTALPVSVSGSSGWRNPSRPRSAPVRTAANKVSCACSVVRPSGGCCSVASASADAAGRSVTSSISGCRISQCGGVTRARAPSMHGTPQRHNKALDIFTQQRLRGELDLAGHDEMRQQLLRRRARGDILCRQRGEKWEQFAESRRQHGSETLGTGRGIRRLAFRSAPIHPPSFAIDAPARWLPRPRATLQRVPHSAAARFFSRGIPLVAGSSPARSQAAYSSHNSDSCSDSVRGTHSMSACGRGPIQQGGGGMPVLQRRQCAGPEHHHLPIRLACEQAFI